MDIAFSDDIKNKVEQLQHKPLVENVLNVKVPYRYKRVDCKVTGLTPVQDLKEGDEIFNSIQYCGQWGGGVFWKFDLIEKIDPPR